MAAGAFAGTQHPIAQGNELLPLDPNVFDPGLLNLKGWWEFDGDYLDKSAGLRHLAEPVANNLQFTADDGVGERQSLLFPAIGANDFLICADPADDPDFNFLGEYSFFCWVRPVGTGAFRIACFESPTNGNHPADNAQWFLNRTALSTASSPLGLYMGWEYIFVPGVLVWYTTLSMFSDVWNFVAMIRRSDGVGGWIQEIYINGVAARVPFGTVGAGETPSGGENGRLVIGADGPGGQRASMGLCDLMLFGGLAVDADIVLAEAQRIGALR